MKKINIIILISLLCVVIFGRTSVYAKENSTTIEWQNTESEQGVWEYYEGIWKYLKADHTYATNTVLYIDGAYYSFDKNGHMETGWQYKDQQWYYFLSWGGMQTGWQYVDGYWYYMDESGVMQTGWQYVDGYWYYMNAWGVMQTGWQYVDGYWYYMNAWGVMQTGWQYVDGYWYYMNAWGVMQAGWQYVNGYWYYMNASGIMQTDWQYINGNWYYLNSSGAMQTGWKYISGYKHYFSTSGEMCSDLRGFVSGPYHIKVNRSQNCVTVYAEEAENKYAIPVVAFLCSTGGRKTPTGTFLMSTQYRWHQLYGAAGQYCSRIVDHVLFHSVPYRRMGDIYSMMPGQFNKLGSTASAGCIRLSARDAKWIYDYCREGQTYVQIYDGGSSSPLGRPYLPKIPYNQTWDPTDPSFY